ncbi:iron ABC transporter substrate-binding protein [Microlunatus endophyticus]|uniref:Iron ABC transporter substrate-binding protein n=1 Tax=Microlunatus endophyticus TaxID=1716077 RepID=A0A917S415_9ACTN|nr:ABC transporter substrate-binding protein [Microlunatus endophyticus]GGL56097.1 iron ABC transporter substrate-binding protein [Microlunatus endophyticus]
MVVDPGTGGAPARTWGRRGMLLGGLGVTASLIAACGTDTDAAGPSGSPSTARSLFPVTVPGKEGSVTVKTQPSRVVAAGYLRDTDLALALDVPLVGAAKNSAFASGLAPWQKPSDSPELFDTTNGLPLEKIAGLRPDLIMASDDYTLIKDWANLAKIAPTLSYLSGVGADSWQTMTTRAGTVLGKPDQAQQLIKKTHDAIASAKKSNPQLAGKTYTFGPVSSLDSLFTINDDSDASAQFFDQLGMRLSPEVTSLPTSSTPRRAQLSMERIGLLDADVLILAFPDLAVREQLEAEPLFKKLKAVQRGSYVAFDMAAAVAVAFPSVLSIPYGLQVTVPKLVAAASKV